MDIDNETERRAGHVFVLAALLALAGILWLSWQFWGLSREMKLLQSRDHRLVELAGEIVHLDEVLTMSARMAAATLDPAWEARYRRYEPQLDNVIEESLRIGPGIIGKFIAETDAANRSLVEMENRTFELVHQKDQRAAAAILSSSEYERQKQRYAEGVRQLSATVETRAHAAMDAQQRRIPLVFVTLLVVLAILSLFWMALLRANKRRVEAEQQARQSTEQARGELEKRVADATADLTAVNHRLVQEMESSRKSEEALQESEGKYRLIADNMADTVSVMDLAMRFTYLSPSIMRLRGFTVEEALAQTIEQVMTPDAQEVHRSARCGIGRRSGTLDQRRGGQRGRDGPKRRGPCNGKGCQRGSSGGNRLTRA
jgi:PAS domain S-box-containing protein